MPSGATANNLFQEESQLDAKRKVQYQFYNGSKPRYSEIPVKRYHNWTSTLNLNWT